LALVTRRPSARIIFITGTDTGAGKTVLTGLLLRHLRNSGCHALAMKPFCSGGLGDVNLLRALQDGELSDREINPFYFPEPVAPLVSARAHGRRILLTEVLRCARGLARRCDCLLIEGSGGLLVPLGEGYTALDLILRLRCEVMVAARNRLGVINHALLTLRALRGAGLPHPKVVLMEARRADPSAATNVRMLEELGRPVEARSLPFLGARCASPAVARRSALRVRTALAGLLAAPGTVGR